MDKRCSFDCYLSVASRNAADDLNERLPSENCLEPSSGARNEATAFKVPHFFFAGAPPALLGIARATPSSLVVVPTRPHSNNVESHAERFLSSRPPLGRVIDVHLLLVQIIMPSNNRPKHLCVCVSGRNWLTEKWNAKTFFVYSNLNRSSFPPK